MIIGRLSALAVKSNPVVHVLRTWAAVCALSLLLLFRPHCFFMTFLPSLYSVMLTDTSSHSSIRHLQHQTGRQCTQASNECSHARSGDGTRSLR